MEEGWSRGGGGHVRRAGWRIVAACAAVAVLAACGGGPASGGDAGSGASELAGYTLEPAPEVGDLDLPDVTAGGEPMSLRASDGGLLAVFFGYTSCPDVCPLTMAHLSGVAKGDVGVPFEVAMVTVDPGRDTETVLGGYVTGFLDAAHGLRTEDDSALRAVTNRLGVDYTVNEADDGSVEVGHTGSTFVLDDEGKVVVVWPYGTTPDDMRSDLGLLAAPAAR